MEDKLSISFSKLLQWCKLPRFRGTSLWVYVLAAHQVKKPHASRCDLFVAIVNDRTKLIRQGQPTFHDRNEVEDKSLCFNKNVTKPLLFNVQPNWMEPKDGKELIRYCKAETSVPGCQ